MPELPEVETVVRQLDEVLPGRVVRQIEVLRDKSAGNELSSVMGEKIGKVYRKAKYILVEFDNTDKVMAVHLKMTGQLVFDEGESNISIRDRQNRVVGGHPTADWVADLPSKHTRIIIGFNDGSKLYFNDQRVFGWMKVFKTEELKSQMIDRLPPDVVDHEFTRKYLAEVLSRSRRAVKLVILDQQKMGGMGNIYANDALHIAKIHPIRQANSMLPNEIARLHKAMQVVLIRGIELGGASYSNFVQADGLGGKYQDEFVVYDKEGDSCPREDCGGIIERVKLGGRGTYYCPLCQQ